jgi:hypothetical protein
MELTIEPGPTPPAASSAQDGELRLVSSGGNFDLDRLTARKWN